MSTRLDTRYDLERWVEYENGHLPWDSRRRLSADLLALGLPIYSHRGPRDGCPPDCCSGWPDAECIAAGGDAASVTPNPPANQQKDRT